MKKKNKKCVLILPYFGKFNNYFPLFLKSCAENPSYTWMIFTDNEFNYECPQNVHIIKCTLRDIIKVANNKFGFKVVLDSPYKLCDYKPAYGFLFEEYIRDFEYWGHCDCDLIFGNIEKIITPLLNEGYDKLFAAGHLTIYKNTYDNNRRFMKLYKGRYLYKEAFTKESTNWITPISAPARFIDLRMILRISLISCIPMKKNTSASPIRMPRFSAFSGRVSRKDAISPSFFCTSSITLSVRSMLPYFSCFLFVVLPAVLRIGVFLRIRFSITFSSSASV